MSETKYCPKCDEMKPTRVEKREESYKVIGKPIKLEAWVRLCNECDNDIFDENLDDDTLKRVFKKARVRC